MNKLRPKESTSHLSAPVEGDRNEAIVFHK